MKIKSLPLYVPPFFAGWSIVNIFLREDKEVWLVVAIVFMALTITLVQQIIRQNRLETKLLEMESTLEKKLSEMDSNNDQATNP